jgi:hypothetical protein
VSLINECIVCGNQTVNGIACDARYEENEGRDCWMTYKLWGTWKLDEVAMMLRSMPVEARAIWLTSGGYKNIK